ncbi:glutaredoxin-like YruB-family protein [Clostridium punense]|uniref:Glutaredoxin-like YruB-family protein n=1 Tax=Clostridium punense TaxID=1054297 RepID=A0ABS4JZM0_9CLOT|nr:MULTISPECIES: glutaredoxin domain-containing protein [Clostridium]EQB87008.1 hypothetical protein M918_11020 [Clostridium sp. BL8]MBP2020979.1 glutaredoxin-like YruB-family protein [Clostridium punense]
MNKVEIYTSDTCGYCHQAKDFLQSNNIDYLEYNISRDLNARKTLMRKGYMSVPLLVINGEEILGFDRERICSILGL